MEVVEGGIATPRVPREKCLIVTKTSRRASRIGPIFSFVEELVQGRKIVALDGLRAAESRDSRLTTTLSSETIAFCADGAANVTVAIDTAKKIRRLKKVGVPFALVTLSSLNIRTTHALTGVTVTQTDATHCAILVADAFFTAVLVAHLQVPM